MYRITEMTQVYSCGDHTCRNKIQMGNVYTYTSFGNLYPLRQICVLFVNTASKSLRYETFGSSAHSAVTTATTSPRNLPHRFMMTCDLCIGWVQTFIKCCGSDLEFLFSKVGFLHKMKKKFLQNGDPLNLVSYKLKITSFMQLSFAFLRSCVYILKDLNLFILDQHLSIWVGGVTTLTTHSTYNTIKQMFLYDMITFNAW